MNRLNRAFRASAVVLASVLVAVIIGIAVVYVISIVEEKGRWERLASPPGEVIGLMAGSIDHVAVETESGAIYEIECLTSDDYPCLRRANPPEDLYRSLCYPEDLPMPEDNVRDHLSACVEHEYMIRAQYELRDDGSLWRWRIEIYPFGQLARALQIMGLSIVVGLVAGIIIVNRRSI